MPRVSGKYTPLEDLLRLDRVSKSFGGVQALCDVSFELRAGEVHALVGENGAGKSTLIKIVTGVHSPDSGSLHIAGRSVQRNDPALAKQLGVVAIYQQPALFPDLTVAENIALRLESRSAWRVVRWGERRRRAQELLERAGAKISPQSLARELSMPQQQLVEIAGALGANARILILDEPTASLSDREVENLFRVIGEMRRSGVGLIYISHRLDELPRIADRVTVLRDGRCIATRPTPEVQPAELIRFMVGRTIEAVYPQVLSQPGDVVLEARNLTRRSGGIQGVSFTVRSGEILGLAGLVGAGRTEVARALFGVEPADGGQILLRGKAVKIESPAHAVALGIGYLPEDRRRHGVILEMPACANTSLAVLRTLSQRGLIDFAAERALCQSFIGQLSIKTPSPDTLVANLSGGNQQKVALSRWLACKPAVLILDEPTQGVDVGAKAEIHKLMGELAQKGLAILMISSELPEILGMSHRIAVMREGRIVEVLDGAAATQQRVLELALGHAPGAAA